MEVYLNVAETGKGLFGVEAHHGNTLVVALQSLIYIRLFP